MSIRPLLRQRAIAPASAGIIAAGIALFPKTVLHAEAPDHVSAKKPIYSDYEPTLTLQVENNKTSSITAPYEAQKSKKVPSPTDRLTAQIGTARIFLHGYVSAAEDKLNEAIDSALDLEQSFTRTIASLAPAPHTGEKLMPGSIYVLVAAMAGSIVSRRRNAVLRGLVPAAVGLGAAWILLPVTMTNVSALLWKYEEKFPVIADSHMRTRESVQRVWYTGKAHSGMAVQMLDDKIKETKEAVEDWVRKGK